MHIIYIYKTNSTRRIWFDVLYHIVRYGVVWCGVVCRWFYSEKGQRKAICRMCICRHMYTHPYVFMHAYMCLCDVFVHVFGKKGRPESIKLKLLARFSNLFLYRHDFTYWNKNIERRTKGNENCMHDICALYHYHHNHRHHHRHHYCDHHHHHQPFGRNRKRNYNRKKPGNWSWLAKYIWAETDVTFSYQSQSKPKSAFQMQHEDYRKEFEILPHFFVNENYTRC